MQKIASDPRERTGEPYPAALLDVRAVAALLGCSPRHVYRLADAGEMPAPVHLGGLCRWCRVSLELWIADGCPPCTKGSDNAR